MIPRNVIDNLRCSFCNNSLSVFPIYTYGDKNTISCGRCPKQDEFLPQREILYEELAQHIEFSCQYESNGCIEKLKPADLQTHESCCIHKPCFCPIVPLGCCKWQGDHNELFTHFRDLHSDFVHEEFFMEIDIVKCYEENHVFHQANERFVLQIECNKKVGEFNCNVRYCGPASAASKFLYRACFTNKKKKHACKIQHVQPGEIGPIINGGITTIRIAELITKLNYPATVVLQIDILVEKPQAEKQEESMTTSTKEENEILKMLECPVCLEFMVPPIFQCNRGHSFCEPCRNKITTCPTCTGAVEETRNYLLEKITEVMEYPCKYSKFGCAFFGNAQGIKNHEANCENGPYDCVIADCSWKDKYSELLKHVNEVHKDNVLETNDITYIIDYDLDKEKCEYIIVLDNKLFKVEFTKDGDQFSWIFLLIDKNKKIDNYIFELDFQSSTSDRLYIKKHNLPQFSFCMKELLDFMANEMLTYKIRVSEVI